MKRSSPLFVFTILVLAASCRPYAPGAKAMARYETASLAFRDGRFPESRKIAAALSAKEPRFRQARLLAAKSAWFDGDAPGAIALLKGLDPDWGATRLWLARASLSAGKSEAARRAIESALSADPDDPRTLRLASLISSEAGDRGAAKAYLNRAISSAAELALAYEERARIEWIEGDAGPAIADLKTAQALLPEDSAVRKAANELERTISAQAGKAR